MAGKIMNKVLYFMGIGENADEQEEEMEEVVVQRPVLEPVKKNNVVSMPTPGGQMKLVLIEPTSYEDVQDICDNLKNKKPVVINFENLDKDIARRMVDFVSGAVYAIDGNIQKVSNGIVVAAPPNVDILGSIGDMEGESFDFEKFMDWLK
ncbi:cell division protein SepF [Lutispora thermophila]|uniref:Cell division protein SepF n=1 Tax=Lutispora thermophila DSM 19022 TaxID=1122184 RepID=A0A1M6G234_9FIRM|nr:cell division protein SepF [Lutispora thermophila]SHJ03990.1 cell division inhibitor SepF [Lutispora thermophila DSM 19022]